MKKVELGETKFVDSSMGKTDFLGDVKKSKDKSKEYMMKKHSNCKIKY